MLSCSVRSLSSCQFDGAINILSRLLQIGFTSFNAPNAQWVSQRPTADSRISMLLTVAQNLRLSGSPAAKIRGTERLSSWKLSTIRLATYQGCPDRYMVSFGSEAFCFRILIVDVVHKQYRP